MPHVLVLDVNT